MVSLKSVVIALPLALVTADPVLNSCVQCRSTSNSNLSDCYSNSKVGQVSTKSKFCQTTVVFRQNSATSFTLKNDTLLEVSRSPSPNWVSQTGTTCDVQYADANQNSYLVKCSTVCSGNNCNDLSDPFSDMMTTLRSAKCYD